MLASAWHNRVFGSVVGMTVPAAPSFRRARVRRQAMQSDATSRSRLGRASQSIALAASLSLGALSGCGGPELSNVPTTLSSDAVSPGDSFFGVLPHVVVEAYPSTNLPPTIAAHVREPFRMERRIEREEFIYSGAPPGRFGKYLDEPASLWRAQPRLSLTEGRESVTLRLRGEAIPKWELGVQPFPGIRAWYEPKRRSVFVISRSRPGGLSIEYWTDSVVELGRYEKRLGASPAPTARSVGAATMPSAGEIVQREEIAAISRPSLLLPAPGSVALHIDDFPFEALQLAVGVVDRSYALQSGRLVRIPQGSDGVEFSVEVTHQDGAERVWQHLMPAGEVGVAFPEFVVDLSAYRGLDVTLRLRSGPGPDSNADFDYAIWSGLQFLAQPEQVPEAPDIVLIDIDTLRPDRMSVYGYDRPTTPRLREWAQSNAVVFRNALATSSWTLPSTASMLTGLAPHQHQVNDHDRRLTRDTPTLAMILRAVGYDTYSYAEGGFFRTGFGFDLGFDFHDSGGGDMARHFRMAINRLRTRRSERPFFLYLHSYAIHAPYEADDRFAVGYEGFLAGRSVGYDDVIEPYLAGDLELSEADQEYVSSLYDAALPRMDRVVVNTIGAIEAIAPDRARLIIVTSDHGEEIFEHGRLIHGHSLYSEVLRVPLIVKFPAESGQRRVGFSDAPASLLDIVPTVLDYAGLKSPAILSGYSLRSLPERRVRVAQTFPKSHTAVQFAGRKLILNAPRHLRWSPRPVQLYLLKSDPRETVNVAESEPESVRELKQHLRGFLREYPPLEFTGERTSQLGGEDLDNLRALGYVD